jgi:pimeloyl-ACP methyl ester carboxylesterase
VTQKLFTHQHWHSPDGLTLHFRRYEGRCERSPVICLHGLTRNARDFEQLAPHIASTTGRLVLVPEMRGRGRSAYAADPATYAIPTYVADTLALLEQEQIKRFVAIGTSMGGLIIMAMALLHPDRIAGAVLNDVGPVVEPEGLQAIKQYVGQGGSFPTWVHAARSLAEVHADTYPHYDLADWLAMAKRTMVLVSNGRVAFDYDMRIAEPILAAQGDGDHPDLWPMLKALAGRPTVLVRGERSRILSAATFAQMAQSLPGARTVTVPATGHAPTLDEPEVKAAIDAMLAEAA